MTGEQIDSELSAQQYFFPNMDKAWIRFNAAGECRIEIETTNWLKPALVGVAFDEIEAELKKAELEASNDDVFERCYGEIEYVKPSQEMQPSVGIYGFTWEEHISKDVLKWPKGVRRYSYRCRPDLPQGVTPAHDNVQLAFNVLPDEEKSWYPAAPGTFKGFAGYQDTDYEFALNPVALEFGGGVEIWKLRAPYLPEKHYYPRSPKHPREGAVKDGALVIVRDGDWRIVEAAIPWTEIPEVKAARDAGKPIKFSCRVNDNAKPSVCMELAYDRSVSQNNGSFMPGWAEHWANELEFGWSSALGEHSSPSENKD